MNINLRRDNEVNICNKYNDILDAVRYNLKYNKPYYFNGGILTTDRIRKMSVSELEYMIECYNQLANY